MRYDVKATQKMEYSLAIEADTPVEAYALAMALVAQDETTPQHVELHCFVEEGVM